MGRCFFNKQILLKLKKYLETINFHLLLTIVLGEEVYFINPLPDYNKVKLGLKKLDKQYQNLFSFFLLGEPISIHYI